MKRSVCGSVHRPCGTCAGQGGGGMGGLNGLVWRGQQEPRHNPGHLAGSLLSGAGRSSVSVLAA